MLAWKEESVVGGPADCAECAALNTPCRRVPRHEGGHPLRCACWACCGTARTSQQRTCACYHAPSSRSHPTTGLKVIRKKLVRKAIDMIKKLADGSAKAAEELEAAQKEAGEGGVC